MPEQPSGGLANAAAYASLPRKYSPLMNVKTSPMVAPSVDLSRWASAERAFFRNRKPARFPEQWAGESRKIRWLGDIEPEYTRRSRRGSSRIGPLQSRRASPGAAGYSRPPVPPTCQGEQCRADGDPHHGCVERDAHRQREPQDLHDQEVPQRERREHDDHHGRGAGDDGTGLREALRDRRTLV